MMVAEGDDVYDRTVDLADDFRRNVHRAPKAMRMLGHTSTVADEHRRDEGRNADSGQPERPKRTA